MITRYDLFQVHPCAQDRRGEMRESADGEYVAFDDGTMNRSNVVVPIPFLRRNVLNHVRMSSFREGSVALHNLGLPRRRWRTTELCFPRIKNRLCHIGIHRAAFHLANSCFGFRVSYAEEFRMAVCVQLAAKAVWHLGAFDHAVSILDTNIHGTTRLGSSRAGYSRFSDLQSGQFSRISAIFSSTSRRISSSVRFILANSYRLNERKLYAPARPISTGIHPPSPETREAGK